MLKIPALAKRQNVRVYGSADEKQTILIRFFCSKKQNEAETELITTTVLTACNNKEDNTKIETPKTTLRAKFIKGKSFEEVKLSFSKLTTIEKYTLWDEKLDQLLSENLPTENKNLIKELKIELVNLRDNNPNKITEIAIKLARVTPKQDFINMFRELENYEFKGKFQDTQMISENIINDFKINQNQNKENESKKLTYMVKDCNCSWTCDSTVGGYTTNCNETKSGCGFMWQYPCTGKVL